MNKSCDVVILTCDDYSDIWEPFFILKNRYWNDCYYNTYLITETKNCSECKTININENIWTKRVREGLKRLKSDYVIILLEDFFLRGPVDNKRIEFCMNNFSKNTACFNFEKTYDQNDKKSNIKGFKIKTNKSKYKCSCQAAIWDRKKLISLLSKDCNAWEWETSEPLENYDFYINDADLVFDYGYKNMEWFGIRKGKWVKKDVVPLFKKEKIFVNFKNRGFYKETSLYKRIYQKIKRKLGKYAN